MRLAARRAGAGGYWIAALLLAGCCAGAGAQSPWDDALAPLDSGSLVVWVVVPSVYGTTAPPRITHENKRAKLLTPEQAAEAAAASPHYEQLQHEARWDILRSRLQRAYPDLYVEFEYVTDRELSARLAAAAGTDDAPDVLLGAPLAAVPISAIWRHEWVWQSETDDPNTHGPLGADVAILPDAANNEAAWALALWLSDDGMNFGRVEKTAENAAAGEAAAIALTHLLQGQQLSAEADRGLAAPKLTDAGYRDLGPGVGVGVNITSIEVNRRSAVVALRAERGMPLEIVHALMVLRRSVDGRWLVLHVSWDLAPELQCNAFRQLGDAGTEWTSRYRNEGNQPLGVSQATPKDGDTLPPRPELWWDNRGGATLQVVEWQWGGTGTSRQTRLFFAPDTQARLRTGTVARFAERPAQYRWRVWSVGADRTIVLSPWRTLNISQAAR